MACLLSSTPCSHSSPPLPLLSANLSPHQQYQVEEGGDVTIGEHVTSKPERKSRKSLQGLGLGLYIASQIAEAHGGRIDVQSGDEETRFTFRMPL